MVTVPTQPSHRYMPTRHSREAFLDTCKCSFINGSPYIPSDNRFIAILSLSCSP